MLAHVVDIIVPKTRPTNHKRRDQNLQNKQKSKKYFVICTSLKLIRGRKKQVQIR